MPKDAIGNTLSVGDLVHATFDSANVVARVVKVQLGGTLIATNGGKNARMTPGMIVLMIESPILFDPADGVVHSCVRVVDPNPNRQAQEPKIEGVLESN